LTEKFGRYINVNKWWDHAKKIGEKEKQWLDSKKVMTFEQFITSKPWTSNAS